MFSRLKMRKTLKIHIDTTQYRKHLVFFTIPVLSQDYAKRQVIFLNNIELSIDDRLVGNTVLLIRPRNSSKTTITPCTRRRVYDSRSINRPSRLRRGRHPVLHTEAHHLGGIIERHGRDVSRNGDGRYFFLCV